MTIPRRDPHASPAEEARRLRAIAEGITYQHPPDHHRVRRLGDGAGGCRHGSSIYSDADPQLQCLAYWQTWTQENQEDFGYPPAGWSTGLGVWLDEAES